MSGIEKTLSVILNDKLVAELSLVEQTLVWKYSPDWKKEGYQISPHLPLDKPCQAWSISNFLNNLLPEGEGLDEISLQFQISKGNTYGLVRALGKDLPGAFMVINPNSSEDDLSYIRPISEDELISRLDNRQQNGIVIWDHKPRLSNAGIQDKINIFMTDAGNMGFAEGNLCSTHILKFERIRQAHLVINEFTTMQLAKHCGLDVADVRLINIGEHKALLIKRFDRKKISDEIVQRGHIIDGCQALDLPPSHKYERPLGSSRDVKGIRDGASLPKLFEFANTCLNPALTKLTILRWALFNCITYNFDAHGKNISFFVGRDGIQLTPFYDLVNIAMYPDYEQHLAMALGDEFDGHTVKAYQLADFADSCQIPRKLLERELKTLVQKVLDSIPRSDPEYSAEEKAYMKKYYDLLTNKCEHFLNEIPLIGSIVL